MLKKRYITSKETSKITGLATKTLANHRYYCTGLPYYKVGNVIRYDYNEVIEFMENHRIAPIK